MFGLARSSIVAITIAVATVYYFGSLRLGNPEPEIGAPLYWEGQTFLPAQWDADFCAKQHSKNRTCVIGQTEKVATLCTEASTARTWPHVKLNLVIPEKGELRDAFREARLKKLANASRRRLGESSASGGPYYIVSDSFFFPPASSSSSSSGGFNPNVRYSRYDNSSGSSSSSAWVHIHPRRTYGTFFDMIVASDLRSFGTNEDVHRFLRTLYLDRETYSYDSGNWTAKALARRGFQAGDQITVSVPLSPATRKHLENLRSGTKTSEGLFDPLSPILIQLDNARKIRDEITGCPKSDRQIGVMNFDETDFSGSWARWQSGPVEPKLQSLTCTYGSGMFYVADDKGGASTWRVHRKRGSQYVRREKIRVEPPYVHVQSDNAETQLFAVHVSKDIIVLKEILGSNSSQLNRFVWLQRCEESFDAAVLTGR